VETIEKLKPLTNKEKKYIWATFIELLVMNGYNIQKLLFNPPRLKHMNCTNVIDEIIKQENIFSGNTKDSLKEWELLKNRYNFGINSII
jgi:hypothetical protein